MILIRFLLLAWLVPIVCSIDFIFIVICFISVTLLFTLIFYLSAERGFYEGFFVVASLETSTGVRYGHCCSSFKDRCQRDV
jgi:fatty acid desaturase